ncbi:hypothetical protein J8L88_03885 [Aquimarina sp. MMG015]|uniref:hypothetical protein n=1 Tax=Aquimarina TaxID=290174 RepID=UPI0003FCF9C8|nr:MULTISPECIES: hypothetical protein [Aquimarina]MBQ4801982.1 hypothetical protein [Aquimarina sp. MMG015]
MATFLLILGGLIAFNFVLLKFSMQSVDSEKKKNKAVKSVTNSKIKEPKTSGIPKAA